MIEQGHTFNQLETSLNQTTFFENEVPVGISARHIHLAQEDINVLFGEGHQLKKYRDLYQAKEFAAEETLTVVGPKGVIEEVRIIGPARKNTQIEVSRTDAIKLGIKAPIRNSGNIRGTPGCVLIGPKNILTLKQGVIIPAAHIHMNPTEAKNLQVADGDQVAVSISGQRSVTFNNVLIRVSPEMKLEMHLDTDEANAAFISNAEKARLVSPELLH